MHWTERITQFFDDATRMLIAIATDLGPWLAPFAPMFAVQRSLVKHLDIPVPAAWASALAIEVVGIGALNVTLAAFREKDRSRLRLALGVISIIAYLGLGMALTIGLGETWSIAGFFVLAGVAYLTQGLRVQHAAQARREREEAEEARLEEKIKKTWTEIRSLERRGLPVPPGYWRTVGFDKPPVRETVHPSVRKASGGVKQNARQAILDAVGDEYLGTMTQLAVIAGVSRPTLYTHLDALESEGIISRNTNRVSILTHDSPD